MDKKKQLFIHGPITPEFIAASIAKHQSKKTIGAHEIFLGQVRADNIGGKSVNAIEYSAYAEMALEKTMEIREAAFEKFELTCLHVYHSLGTIACGEICFFVFVSSRHRTACREALAFLVDTFKSEVPVFGKEIYEDQGHHWKVNN